MDSLKFGPRPDSDAVTFYNEIVALIESVDTVEYRKKLEERMREVLLRESSIADHVTVEVVNKVVETVVDALRAGVLKDPMAAFAYGYLLLRRANVESEDEGGARLGSRQDQCYRR